jgi:hypothetical protein
MRAGHLRQLQSDGECVEFPSCWRSRGRRLQVDCRLTKIDVKKCENDGCMF